MRVCVLGCGPAGLLAAHAATLRGHSVDIMSVKQKSVMGGAQYLHTPIPELTSAEPDGMLTYRKRGTREGYAAKVYGSPHAPCSWDHFALGEHPAWSLKGVYDALWYIYSDMVFDKRVGLDLLAELQHQYDRVISSVPLPSLCHSEMHEFGSQTVYFTNDSPLSRDNFVEYNGDEVMPWYRTSRIFGIGSTEYSEASVTPQVLRAVGRYKGIKPTTTNCDCNPGVMRVGRFGRWQKGVLVHHAFQEVMNALQ